MPLLRNVIDRQPFSAVEQTARIPQDRFEPTFMRNLGIARVWGTMTAFIGIQEDPDNGGLVPFTERSGPAVQHGRGKRTLRHIKARRLALEERVGGDEIQGVISNDGDLTGVQELVSGVVDEMRSRLDYTEEHMLLGMVNGKILDANGNVEIDLFDEFNVTAESSVNFKLDTSNTDVKKRCHQIKRTQKVNAGQMGSTIARHHALCGHGAFDRLVTFPEVKEAYDRMPMLRQGQAHDFVDYAGIRFWDYPGNGEIEVPDNEMRFFPEAPGLFWLYYAPGDVLPATNRRGYPRYAMTAVDPEFEQYIKVHVQSDPLPLCLRPKVLMSGTAT
jgi:hypothetical protein